MYFAALGQIMLYVDGMEGIASHTDTVQWLYTLLSSQVAAAAADDDDDDDDDHLLSFVQINNWKVLYSLITELI